MKQVEYQTLKKRKTSLDEYSVEVATVSGYNFFVEDTLFFVYNETNWGWIVVDPKVGLSFSKHFKTRNLAIEDTKKHYKDWFDYTQTINYQKMIEHYLSLKNEIVKGQMSIYDYE